jgi:hypothetical protein
VRAAFLPDYGGGRATGRPTVINRALINRGSLTLWIDEEAAHTQWCNHEKNGRRGRDLTYSDWAIQGVLTLKVLYRLPLRATQGLGSSLEIIYQRRHPGLDAGIQCPRW